MKNFSVSKGRIILVAMLFPLFFINVKDSHDWGDDFTQYLIQARNLIEGIPQSENGLIQNDEAPYAIKAYPVGLPLLISPIYYFFNLKIFPYCVLFSVVLFITGIISFEFFRKRTDIFSAIIIVLLFCYNVNTLAYKKQILSEIPFTCILMTFILWTQTKFYRKKYAWIITSVIIAALVSLRLAGIAIVAAFFLNQFLVIYRLKDAKSLLHSLKIFLFTACLSLLLFSALNDWLFPIFSAGLFSFYGSAFQSHSLQLASNARFYYKISEFMFPFFGGYVPGFWIILAISGWIIAFIKKNSFAEYAFPFYILIILIYPYTNAGLRFLIPVLPLLIYYLYYFIVEVKTFLRINSFLPAALILILLLFSYMSPVKSIINTQHEIEEGPQEQVSVELFSYLKGLPADAVMVFCKARAISLYSGHRSLYSIKDQERKSIYKLFQRQKILFLIVAKVGIDDEIYDPVLTNYIGSYQNDYKKVWENARFNVYRQW